MAKKTTKPEVKKIGIYLPDVRVKDVEIYRDRMNFSSMFWSAFDTEKHRLDCLPKDELMSTVIDRLRKSKKAFELDQMTNGREAGAVWAAESADFEELVKLRTFSEEQQRRGIELNEDDIAALFPSYNFWESALGEDQEPDTGIFVIGFVTSALDIFEKAEAQGL